jgi:hypothetical protein
MKRMIWILALAILPGLLSAQTTVATVTITVPTAAVPIVNAWIATQCAVYATDGITCVTPQYASAKDLAQQIVQAAINAKLMSILQWAVTTTDPSIPAAVKTQITNRLNAQAAIANAQTAAATATVTAN